MILGTTRKPISKAVTEAADAMCKRSIEVRRAVCAEIGRPFDELAKCPACPFDECRLRRACKPEDIPRH